MLRLGVWGRRLLSSGAGREIDPSKLQVIRASAPKPKVANDKLMFGNVFTDHMLEIDWDSSAGWHDPLIRQYGNLSLSPAASSLHYALQAFEGMKAYLDDEGRIRLFRPDRNMARLNASAHRLCFPTFDEPALLKCLKELIKVDRDWIPEGDGYSLYIRPTLISTHPFLGVGPPKFAKLFVILSPVGPYYREGWKAVSLLASNDYVRAWPGGSGNSKVGANYGPTILPQVNAAGKGFSQVLWLFGSEGYVTEVGTMNQFFFWKNESGETELVTPPLDGTILPGVTRDSVLSLAKQWGEFKVSERPFTIHDVIKAVDQGRMIEAFGAGTAAIVSPVKMIHYKGKDYKIPLDPDVPDSQAGKLAKRFAKSIMDIQYGRTPSPWSVIVD